MGIIVHRFRRPQLAAQAWQAPTVSLLPDEVQCQRLTLRRWTAGDAVILDDAVQANLEHLRPWMPWIAAEPLAIEDRRRLIESWEQDWTNGGDVILGAFLDHTVVGGCGLHHRAGPDTLEIGYWIHVDHLGHGYATEIARALTSAAFQLPGITRTEIHHDIANAHSRLVPERLGYNLDGQAPDEIAAPGELGIDVSWSMSRINWHDS